MSWDGLYALWPAALLEVSKSPLTGLFALSQIVDEKDSRKGATFCLAKASVKRAKEKPEFLIQSSPLSL